MFKFLVVISALLLAGVGAQQSEPLRIAPVIIPGPAGGPGFCPASEILESARNNVTAAIQLSSASCGGFGWRLVTDLDMGVASQQCPSPWAEITTP